MKQKIIIVLIFLIGIFIFLGYKIYNNNLIYKPETKKEELEYSNKIKYIATSTGDVFKDLKNNEEVKEIINKSTDPKIKAEELKQLAQGTSSQTEKETLELYSASILMESSKDEGVKYYKSIYANDKNSNINRAYALLKVEQYSKGEGRIDYVKEFLDEEEINKAKNNDEIYNLIDNKIYKLYPFAITAARIGLYEIKNNPNKETAEKIYKLYKNNLESGTTEMLRYEGLRHLAANTNLNHALLWAELEKFGIVNKKETQKLFEKAYENARLYSPRGTLQFIVLAYANYSANNNNYTKVDKLIEFLIGEKLNENVITALKNATNNNSYLGIRKYYKETKRNNNFFAQFGW